MPDAFVDAALDHVKAELPAARQRTADRERTLDARLEEVREHRNAEWVDWLYRLKLGELAPEQADAPPGLECREQALSWLDAKLARLPVLGSDGQDLFKSKLADLGRIGGYSPGHVDQAIDHAKAQLQVQARGIARREAAILETPGNAHADLFELGFGKSHRLSLQALERVGDDLRQHFDGREASILRDPEGEEILRDARARVLREDRRPTTLPERAGVVEKAQGLLEAAVAERSAAAADIARLFKSPGGDELVVAALDGLVFPWRKRSFCTSDVRRAIGTAAQNADRRGVPVNEEHQLVLDADREFPDAGSNAWQEASRALRGDTDVDQRGIAISRRLSDRARLREITGREQTTASPGSVKRLVEWLRRRIEQLPGMGRGRPSQGPASDAEVPVEAPTRTAHPQPVPSATSAPAPVQPLMPSPAPPPTPAPAPLAATPPLPADATPTRRELIEGLRAGRLERAREWCRTRGPEDHVRDLVREAMDPKLLGRALGPEVAPAWIAELEKYYVRVSRRSPGTMRDFTLVWAQERKVWEPLPTVPEPPRPAAEQPRYVKLAEGLQREVMRTVDGVPAESDHTGNQVDEELARRNDEAAEVVRQSLEHLRATDCHNAEQRAAAEEAWHAEALDKALAKERRRLTAELKQKNQMMRWLTRPAEPDREMTLREVVGKTIPELVDRIVGFCRTDLGDDGGGEAEELSLDPSAPPPPVRSLPSPVRPLPPQQPSSDPARPGTGEVFRRQ